MAEERPGAVVARPAPERPATGLTAHQEHVSAVARFNHEVVDLDGALDDLLRVLQRSIQRLRDELLAQELSPAGQRNTVLGEKFGRQLKEVTTALTSATQAQRALWATAKERAGKMSPEERAEALKRTVLKLPYLERRAFLLDLCRRHTAAHAEAVETGAEKRLADTQSPITLTMVEVG